MVTHLFLLDFPMLSLIFFGGGRDTFFSNFHRKRTRVVNIVTILRFLRNLKCLYSALTQVWLGIELQVENDPLSPRPVWFLRFQRRPDSQAVRPGSRVSPSQETFTMPSPLVF